jgi:hypothetical protein
MTDIATTEIEKIEAERMTHVVDAMRAALPESLQGNPGLEAALKDMAVAAIKAGDRFPEEGYPFGCNFNTPPADMHPSLVRSFNEIDAGMFSGDSFFKTEDHLYCAAYVQRWSKELRLRREDDYVNRPDCTDEGETPEF